MAINPIGVAGITNAGNVGTITQIGTGSGQTNGIAENGSVSFADYLKDAVGNVNSSITDAQDMQQKLATGQIDDIHSVMIAAEKSDLALQFTLAIRNKVMDAYSEIMRMQV